MAQAGDIKLRQVKGSTLSWTEVDTNFKSFYYTLSVNGNILTLTSVSGSDSVTIATGSLGEGAFGTGSFVINGSINGNVITLTQGDGTLINLTLDTGSYLVTSSIAGNIFTFEKGDGSTYNFTLDTGSYVTSGSWDTSTSEFYLYSGDTTYTMSLASLAEVDTLQTVTNRGNQTTNDVIITGSLTLSGSSSTINTQEIQFDINHSSSGHSTGRLHWNQDEETLNLDLTGNDVVLQIGQEIHLYGRNTSGVTINNGEAVRISGSQGDRIIINLAQSTTHSLAFQDAKNEIIGLATEDITNNNFGYVTVFGTVRGVNTSAFNASDILYVSTASAGALTNTPPPAPYDIIKVGIVERAANDGKIFVKPEGPLHMHDISGITSSNIPTGKSYWQYDSTTKITNVTNQLSGSFSGSFEGDGSGITGVISSSYALTASYVNETLQTVTDRGNQTTNDIGITGSLFHGFDLNQSRGLTYGDNSHTEGWDTVAVGPRSHAEGYFTVAYGTASHAEGQGTIASGSYQTVMGTFNLQGNSTSLVIIGNGEEFQESDLARFNTEGIEFEKPLTASGDISSSGTIYGETASFSYYKPNSPLKIEDSSGSLGTEGQILVSNAQGELVFAPGPGAPDPGIGYGYWTGSQNSGFETLVGIERASDVRITGSLIVSASGESTFIYGSGSNILSVNGVSGEILEVSDTDDIIRFRINDDFGTKIFTIDASGSITASGHISASGNVYGNTGSFNHLKAQTAEGFSPITFISPLVITQPITASGTTISGSFVGDGTRVSDGYNYMPSGSGSITVDFSTGRVQEINIIDDCQPVFTGAVKGGTYTTIWRVNTIDPVTITQPTAAWRPRTITINTGNVYKYLPVDEVTWDKGGIPSSIYNCRGIRRQGDKFLLHSHGNQFIYEGISARIHRIDNSGSRDATWKGDTDGQTYGAWDFYTEPNNKVIIIGNFQQYSGSTDTDRIVRTNPNGDIDTTFKTNGGADGVVYAITPVSGSTGYYIGGSFSTYSGSSFSRIVKITDSGSADTASFNIGSGLDTGMVYGLGTQSDGKVIVLTNANNYSGSSITHYGGGSNTRKIIRLNINGTLDTTFAAANYTGSAFQTLYPSSLAILSDDSILFSDAFQSFGGVNPNNVQKLNSDGTATNYWPLSVDDDDVFPPGGNVSTWNISVENDNSIFLHSSAGGGGPLLQVDGSGSLITSNVIGASVTLGYSSLIFEEDGKFIFVPTSLTLEDADPAVNGNSYTDGTNVSSQLRKFELNQNFLFNYGTNTWVYNGTYFFETSNN